MGKIKLIRHSERLDFSYPFYWILCFGHYWADSPLTTNGYQMARNKGKQLSKDDSFNPSCIYTSPYTRTMATSTEIQVSFPQANIVIEPLLAEYQNYYKHKINLYKDGIPTTFNGEQTNYCYPESYTDFSSRIKFILDKLIEKHDDDIIIVTHSEILKMYSNYILEMYPELMLSTKKFPYLSVLSFTYDKNESKIVKESVLIE